MLRSPCVRWYQRLLTKELRTTAAVETEEEGKEKPESLLQLRRKRRGSQPEKEKLGRQAFFARQSPLSPTRLSASHPISPFFPQNKKNMVFAVFFVASQANLRQKKQSRTALDQTRKVGGEKANVALGKKPLQVLVASFNGKEPNAGAQETRKAFFDPSGSFVMYRKKNFSWAQVTAAFGTRQRTAEGYQGCQRPEPNHEC